MELTKKPQKPIILQGFPGFGLVGTITTEFLIRHCKCEMIGKMWFEDLPAAVAIHKGEIIHPVSIYYNEDYNLVILHSISGGQGIEWKVTDFLMELGNQLDATEFLSLEGIGISEEKETSDVFYHTTTNERKKYLEEKGLKQLNEGVMMGVTSALILKEKRQITTLFVETHADFPDSKAAAELIKCLDKILDLDVDPGPLYESAKKFEENFNKIIQQGHHTQNKKRQMNYLG